MGIDDFIVEPVESLVREKADWPKFGVPKMDMLKNGSKTFQLRRQVVLEHSLEAVISLLYVELKVSSLFVVQFVRCSHLVELDEPFDNLSLAVKFLVRNFVRILDDIDKKRM